MPFIQRTIDVYELTDRDRHSKYAGIGFDVSIIETFPPLCCGGELHIVPDEIRASRCPSSPRGSIATASP